MNSKIAEAGEALAKVGEAPRYFIVAVLVAIVSVAAIASLWDISKALVATCGS